MSFRVLLCDSEESLEIETSLPFAPFVGLMLQLPWRGDDYGAVDTVYWNGLKQAFEIYFAEEDTYTINESAPKGGR